MMKSNHFFGTHLFKKALKRLDFFACILLSSCNYHFGSGSLSESYSTLSVPIIAGDQKGELTSNVIKEVAQSGAFEYSPNNGQLILKIKLEEFEEENIDYCYDRKRSGKLKKSTIPIQTRVNAAAEVSVVVAATGKPILGPTIVRASTEFDHTYYATYNDINVFSLGQLNDIDTAREAAMEPLNRHLAKAIVDWLLSEDL